MRILLLLLCCAAVNAQPLKKFTTQDTAKCKVLYVNAQKFVEIKWGLKAPAGKKFKLYNAAGRLADQGTLIKGLTMTRYDFSTKMPGIYFLFVYDTAGKVIFRRKIENPRGQPAPTIRARR